MTFETTICAISTASGMGAVGIVRVSGRDSFSVAENIVVRRDAFRIAEPRKMLYTSICDEKGMQLDEVMLAKFVSPSSFTGEDMVEIYCHGSEYIEQQIVAALVHFGAVLARPGEFTQRAFLNGKMDLSQSEAVADLISSSSAESHRVALSQLKGKVSSKIAEMRARMLELTALLELELDFSEEDVEFADRTKLVSLIDDICNETDVLISSFKYGNAVKSGVPVAIVGEPNVGKSTLLNVLLHEDRAIVSSEAGTTRDTVEEEFVLEGIRFRFIDTAGIRKAGSEVEELGIRRTYERLKSARIALLVLDASADDSHNDLIFNSIVNEIGSDAKLFVVLNKSDLSDGKCRYGEDSICISALNRTNVDALCRKLVQYVQSLKPETSDVIITNVRHISSLEATRNLLLSAKKSIYDGVPSDFIAQDLREANYHLGEITGAISSDEVLGSIFSKFCIGK
ncbi:MAG: tRNA uridine-5-carboxymethylaminomethyl(34) synthesis GTPase MnmE [Bacteroidales bacterium]|nr:tRNA uridine-5-carboxymethylaminomethyl(34) synthesis GTPase MnmE [Bacteroidales bacterium]